MSEWRQMFDGKSGTILFWLVVLLAAFFLLKMLPMLIGLALRAVVGLAIIYFVFRLFGRDPLKMFKKR
jgi:uncharacterized membrane protein